MYAEPGFMYPLLPSYSNAEFCYDTHQMGNYAQNSTFDYDLGAEGDLFKAPEPIMMEEPVVTLDPLSAALTIISNGQDVMTDTFEVSDMIESLQNEQLNDVFNECKKELLAKYTIDDSLNETAPNANEVSVQGCFSSNAGHLQKSVSSGCLNSMDWVSDGYSSLGHNFLDFPSADFETAFGLRRTCSEGDIQSLGSKGFTSSMPTSFVRQLTISELKSEQRMQKLSRYRDKKNKRNFGRKIKYACRKALADSQPRVKGRFAKTEDGGGLKTS